MKKTLIALTVAALASTSASALTVYNQDKSTIDVGGTLKINLVKETDKKPEMPNKDANINVKAKYGFGDNAYALGFYEYDFLNNVVTKGYLGVGAAGHQVTFGLQNTFADGVGQANFNNIYGVRDGFISGKSNESIAYRFTGVEGLEVGVDYMLRTENRDKAWFDLGAKYSVDNFTVAFAFGKDDKAKAIDAGFAYVMDNVTLGLDAGWMKEDEKSYYVAPGVKVAFGDAAVYANYGLLKVGDAKTHKFNLGTEYSLVKNAKVYAEVGYKKTDAEKTKSIGVGMKVEW